VPSGQERLQEAAKHGFKRAIIPKANMPKRPPDNMEVTGVSKVNEALALI
jgi:DNA repair protein RadA/Sms